MKAKFLVLLSCITLLSGCATTWKPSNYWRPQCPWGRMGHCSVDNRQCGCRVYTDTYRTCSPCNNYNTCGDKYFCYNPF